MVDLRCIRVDLGWIWGGYWEDWRRIGGSQNNVLRFLPFYPLISAFQALSHICQTIDLEEIYRLVSTILNFTPCGSAFGRFRVLCQNLLASSAKIYRKSIEHLSNIYRTSIEHLSNNRRTWQVEHRNSNYSMSLRFRTEITLASSCPELSRWVSRSGITLPTWICFT